MSILLNFCKYCKLFGYLSLGTKNKTQVGALSSGYDFFVILGIFSVPQPSPFFNPIFKLYILLN